jgi:steroid delta-isomerase-like uncharacterized protein
MSLEENKALIRAHVEALFNQHRVEQTEEFFTHDYLDHAPLPGQAPGLAGAKQKWTSYLTAVPDMRATIQDMVAEGDKLAVRWTVQGTHRGELLGIPPTGKPVRFSGISIYRLAAGRSPSNGSSGTGCPCCSSSVSFPPRQRRSHDRLSGLPEVLHVTVG